MIKFKFLFLVFNLTTLLFLKIYIIHTYIFLPHEITLVGIVNPQGGLLLSPRFLNRICITYFYIIC